MEDVTAEVKFCGPPAPKFKGAAPETRPVSQWFIPVVFCGVLLVQILVTATQLSQTADEVLHLYAGYRNLKCADFTYSPEHPPLARLVAAAPIISMRLKDAPSCDPKDNVDGDPGLRLVYMNNAEAVLFRARAAVSVFAILLCLLVWIIGRAMFGATVGTIAAGLTCFEPTILAHGALVTNDVAVAATFLLSVLAFYFWVTRRSPFYVALTGVAVGLTLTAKISGILILPALFLLAFADAWLQREKWPAVLRRGFILVIICLVAFVVLWGVYRFRYAAGPNGIEAPTGRDGSYAMTFLDRFHLLPQSYVEGIRGGKTMSGVGRPMFLLGRMYASGRWFYFPAAMVIKLTGPVLALVALAVFGAKSLARHRRRELLFIAVPAAVYLLASMQSQLNIGIRHVLPVFPFLLIFAAAGCVQLAARRRWLNDVLMVVFVLHAISSVHAMPNYLSYANEFWGGPRNTYKYLADSNSDWGQAIKQIKGYVDRHPGPCWFAAFPTNINPDYYEIPCRQFGLVPAIIPREIQGTVIISSMFLSGVTREYAIPPLKPFADLAPQDAIGGSAMLVFKGDFDMRVPAGIGEVMLARNARMKGDWQESLAHGEAAVQFIPETGVAHAELCKAAAGSGERVLAAQECVIARAKLAEDPVCRKGEVVAIDQVLLAMAPAAR